MQGSKISARVATSNTKASSLSTIKMYVKLSLPDSVTCTAIIILMLVKLNVYDARNNARNNIINIQNLRVDTESVKNALNKLKMIYSPGPDGNHSLL